MGDDTPYGAPGAQAPLPPPPPPQSSGQALRPCARCGAAYYPGTAGRMLCESCIRMEANAAAQANAAKKMPTWARLMILAAILIGTSGFGHVVYGGSVGCTVIAKESWALENTFVDVDDYVGRSKLELAMSGEVKVVRALIRAGILSFESDE